MGPVRGGGPPWLTPRSAPTATPSTPLASWLEKAAKFFDEQVISDQPECPRCDEGHDHGTWLIHDGGCGDVIDGPDDCQCFAGALAVARVINGTEAADHG